MSVLGQTLGYIGLAVAGVMLGLALTMIAVRGARHVAWALERRRSARTSRRPARRSWHGRSRGGSW